MSKSIEKTEIETLCRDKGKNKKMLKKWRKALKHKRFAKTCSFIFSDTPVLNSFFFLVEKKDKEFNLTRSKKKVFSTLSKLCFLFFFFFS